MNDYEQLIEMMFADGTLDQSVRQEIEGMDDLQKRLHIVKILDKGLGLFTKIENIMNLGKMDYIKNILMMLKSYVLIADVEKKKFGEVMTPLTLIKDMLNTLPEEVWSNPELKWLDPANGTGPYPIMVIYKLMVGLKDYEPSDERRYKHILEKMIYVGELQPKNMFLYMNAVDPMNEYNLNIYTGSFLEKEFDNHMKTIWSLDKFDVIFGNPPYNDDGGLKTGGKNLYQKFISKSLNIYLDKILFVTPPGFYKTTIFSNKNEIFSKITSEHSISFLNCSDISNKYFNVGTPIVYYIIENRSYQNTKIVNDDGQYIIDVSKYNFIPRIVNNEIYTILDKITNNGNKLKVYRDDSAKMNIESFLTTSTLNHLSDKGYWNVQIGSPENRKRILILTESPYLLKNLLDTKLYRFIFFIYRHDGAVYQNFLTGFCTPYNLEDDPYLFFGLTKNEIDYIESTIKN